MGTDVCLPVAKYSHATGVRENNTVPWTHIASASLFIIVKGTDSTATNHESLVLRIVQGTDVLESINVSSYIDDAIAARRSAQSSGITINVDRLPIFGITKDTVLALRYTLNDGKARRLQMRMHSSAECRQLVHVFETRGMEFIEQRPGTARPGTARPLTARPPTESTRQPSATHFGGVQQPARHPFATPVLEAGSLSQSHPAMSDALASTAHSQRQHADYESQTMSTPKFFSRDESFAPREVSATRPSTAQLYRPHSTQPSQMIAQGLQSGHTGSFTAPFQTLEMGGAGSGDQHPEARSSLLRTAESEHPQNSSAITSEPHGQAATNTEPRTDVNPATAEPKPSSPFVFTETLEHELPPRRELPFNRPDSRRNQGGGSRPGSALTLPPLPKPRLSRESSNAPSTDMRPPSKPVSPARPHTSSSLKRPNTDLYDSAHSSDRPSTASPQKKASPTKVPSPQAPAKKPGRMDQLLDGRRMSLQKSSASRVPRLNSLADAPGEEDELYQSKEPSPAKSHPPRDSMSPVRRSETDRDPTVNAYAAISSEASHGVGLQQYAEQSFEDRAAALDSFMVQNLENPDFITLCRDVENCWKRIALGL